MSNTRYIWILITLFFCAQVNQSYSQVLLDNESEKYAIDEQVYYFKQAPKLVPQNTKTENDSTHENNIKEILNLFHTGYFTKSNQHSNNLDIGPCDSDIWVAIPLYNITSDTLDFELAILNTDIPLVEFYYADSNQKIVTMCKTGKTHSFESRNIDNRFFVFPFSIRANEPSTLLLKFGANKSFFYAPISLAIPDFHVNHDKPISLFYTFFTGMMLFVVIISLLLCFVQHKRLYILYGTYIFFSTFYFIAEEGLDFQWFYPHAHPYITCFSVIYGALSLFFAIQFSTLFLDLKKTQPQLYKIVKTWEWFFGIYLILYILYVLFTTGDVRHHLASFSFWSKLYISSGWLLQISIVVFMSFKKNVNAYFYLIAISSLIFTATYNILCGLGIIHKMYLPVNPMLVGFSFEIIVLSFALIYRSNLTEKENSRLQITLKHDELLAAEKQIQVLENERTRIAKDLHDDLGSNLASLRLQVEGLPLASSVTTDFKEYLLKILSESSGRLSEITHNLMPPAFHTTPFPDILGNYFDRIKHNPKIFFEFHIINYRPVFTKEIELIIYRITLELCQNIIKHSNASTASIQLIYHEEAVNIVAEDNGVGFQKNNPGLGLESINARVNYLRGQITIDTALGGTFINIEIPYKQIKYGTAD